MKIAITGGAGFIGSNLTEMLLKNGHEVSAYDNLETGNLENLEGMECQFVNGDMRDAESLQRYFRQGNFDYCIHLAALGSVPRSIENPKASFEVNVLGTFNLLETAKKFDLPLIFSSSSSVYGSNVKLPKNELDWMSPISPYGSFKLANEAMMIAYSKSFQLNIRVFRLFNVYGPRQNPFGVYSAVIPRWILSAFKKESLTVFGDGNQRRDFTYVGDVNRIFMQSIKSDVEDPFPTNLAFGNPCSINEILIIFKEYFSNITVEYLPARRGDIRDSESDPSKLQSLFGDFNNTSLRDGLMKVFDWYKKSYGF